MKKSKKRESIKPEEPKQSGSIDFCKSCTCKPGEYCEVNPNKKK